jgi:hypothetical protein
LPSYEIEQYELHATRYRVAASDEAEAIARLLNGQAELVEESQDFIEVAEEYGLPTDERRELAEALRDRGIPIDEVIPSIRSIEEV